MSKLPAANPTPDALSQHIAFDDPKHHLRLYHGDCLELLTLIPENSVDLVFADPPYFLSNNGITCHAGKMVSVNKGDWDKSKGPDANHDFNRAWLAACQRVLKPNGSIWVSGTAHVIHSVGFAMQQLGFKFLNDISWVKPNPPPNLSCRYFTVGRIARPHKTKSTETIPLGRQKQKVPPHLPLQAHERNQPRQTDEVRLGNQTSRTLGEKIRQTPHPKTRRPP